MPGISGARRGKGFVGASNHFDQAGRGVYRFHNDLPLSARAFAGSLRKSAVSMFRKKMRKLLAFLVLLSVPAVAADWVEISSDAQSGFYFDRGSLKRDGDIVEVLLLWNFPEEQITRRPVKVYRSATRLTRYDCNKGGRANIESTLYRDAMANGEITEVYRTPDADIKYEWVNPQAPGGESMRSACGVAPGY